MGLYFYNEDFFDSNNKKGDFPKLSGDPEVESLEEYFFIANGDQTTQQIK
jgi:hypothetical protein